MQNDKKLKKELSRKYIDDFMSIREIVNEYDPMGLVNGGDSWIGTTVMNK